MTRANPYNWTRERPKVEIKRPELQRLRESVLRGRGVVLIGGRGMGKSVALQRLMYIESEGLHYEHFPTRSPVRGLAGFLEALSERDGWASGQDFGAMVSAYRIARPSVVMVAILLDEIDQYDLDEAKEILDHLEAFRKQRDDVAIVAAGGPRVLALGRQLGSPFVSRADHVALLPFTLAQASVLAAPLLELYPAIDLSVIIHLSGGNPCLTTWLLERLWEDPEQLPVDLSKRFRTKHGPFIASHTASWYDPLACPDSLAILSLVDQYAGRVPVSALRSASNSASWDATLRLMSAAGVISWDPQPDADPVEIQRIPSIMLPLPDAPPLSTTATFQERLLRDLQRIIRGVKLTGPDWFGQKKRVLEEKAFSAVVAVSLEMCGWTTAREEQRFAGRTDVKVTRATEAGLAVVELKLWGRNDWNEIHDQVLGYLGDEPGDGFALMVSTSARAPETYEKECLSDLTHTRISPEHWTASRPGERSITHLLLCLLN